MIGVATDLMGKHVKVYERMVDSIGKTYFARSLEGTVRAVGWDDKIGLRLAIQADAEDLHTMKGMLVVVVVDYNRCVVPDDRHQALVELAVAVGRRKDTLCYSASVQQWERNRGECLCGAEHAPKCPIQAADKAVFEAHLKVEAIK